jgi:hypothetical protein
MQQQQQVLKQPSPQSEDAAPSTGWLSQVLCVIGIAAGLYVAFVVGGPSFSDLASMSVFH